MMKSYLNLLLQNTFTVNALPSFIPSTNQFINKKNCCRLHKYILNLNRFFFSSLLNLKKLISHQGTVLFLI